MEGLKKNWKIIGLVLVMALFGVDKAVDIIQQPAAQEFGEATLKAVFDPIIDEKITPLSKAIDRIENKISTETSYPVILLSMEMSECRTADDVDSKMKFYQDNGWNAQLAAMKYLSNVPEARNELKNYIIYDEVYKALLIKAMSY